MLLLSKSNEITINQNNPLILIFFGDAVTFFFVVLVFLLSRFSPGRSSLGHFCEWNQRRLKWRVKSNTLLAVRKNPERFDDSKMSAPMLSASEQQASLRANLPKSGKVKQTKKQPTIKHVLISPFKIIWYVLRAGAFPV